MSATRVGTRTATVHNRVSLDGTRSSAAASEQLPPELFGSILDFVLDTSHRCYSISEHAQRCPSGQDTKCNLFVRHLRQFSLVCRFWAYRVRRHTFHFVVLRSRKQAARFLELLSSVVLPEDLRMGDLVKHICILQNLQALPWFHLITNFIPNTTHLSRYHTLEVTFDTSPSDAAALRIIHPRMRSVHQNLPLSLPHPRSPVRLSKICFSSLSFGCFADIISLSASISRWSRSQHYSSIQWSDHVDIDPAAYLPTRRPSFRIEGSYSLWVYRCTAFWPFLWLCTTTTPPARAGLVIGGYPIFTVPLELQKLAALVMHIIDEPGCDDNTCIQAPDGHCNFEIVQLTTGTRSTRLTITKGVGNAQVEAHISGGHIAALRLRPCRCNYPQATELPGTGALRHGYWSAVDALAADISQAALPVVTVDVNARLGDRSGLVEARAMPRLRRQRRLRLRSWDETSQKWVCTRLADHGHSGEAEDR